MCIENCIRFPIENLEQICSNIRQKLDKHDKSIYTHSSESDIDTYENLCIKEYSDISDEIGNIKIRMSKYFNKIQPSVKDNISNSYNEIKEVYYILPKESNIHSLYETKHWDDIDRYLNTLPYEEKMKNKLKYYTRVNFIPLHSLVKKYYEYDCGGIKLNNVKEIKQ